MGRIFKELKLSNALREIEAGEEMLIKEECVSKQQESCLETQLYKVLVDKCNSEASVKSLLTVIRSKRWYVITTDDMCVVQILNQGATERALKHLQHKQYRVFMSEEV